MAVCFSASFVEVPSRGRLVFDHLSMLGLRVAARSGLASMPSSWHCSPPPGVSSILLVCSQNFVNGLMLVDSSTSWRVALWMVYGCRL
jgi:hypothetical protein